MSDETPATSTEQAPKPPVFPAWWIAIGVALGVAFGNSSAIDLGVGIALGVALGAAVASWMHAENKRRYEEAVEAAGGAPDDTDESHREDPPTP